MSIPILLALTDPAWEAQLVAEIGVGQQPIEIARRCVDLADLLAAGAAGLGRAAVMSADLRRADRDVLTRLAVAGIAVVGAVDADDEPAERQLRQWGIRHIVTTGVDAEVLGQAVLAALGDTTTTGSQWDWADPRSSAGGISRPADAPVRSSRDATLDADVTSGLLVAVWGPSGAPGRSMLAVNLAAEFAAMSGSALLADVDVYGASVAQLLGLLDESPGLAAACRLATAGRLDVASLSDLAPLAGRGLRVVTGISRAQRWPELRPTAVAATLGLAKRLAAWVVADCAFCLEQDEELSFDTAAPRRNGATLAALEAADLVLAVAAGDPVGLQRFVRGVAELREVLPDARLRVVVNRLRRGPVPGDARAEISAALARYAGVSEPWFLPDDPAACDATLAQGRTLAEAAPNSALRRAVADLAVDLEAALTAGATSPKPANARRSSRRRRQS